MEDQILERLSNWEDEKDIILDICLTTGLDWPTVETLVRRLQAEKKHEIVVAQSPWLTLLALVTSLTGIGLITYSVYQILQYSHGFSVSTVVYVTANLQNILGTLVLGLAMVLGSLKGMSAVWESVFEWIRKLSR